MSKHSKTVMIFGTFDILHFGHLQLFRQAKKLGDKLVAVVARDTNVKKVKGMAAFHSEKERKEFLSHIDLIDEVCLGNMKDVYKIIRSYKPDIIALGYDQRVFVDDIQAHCDLYGLHPTIVRLKSHKPSKHKTSHIKRYLDQVV